MGKAAVEAGVIHSPRERSTGLLEIRLFGHLEAALGGERFKIATPRKSLHVLAYVLLHRGMEVPRKHLAFLLYPDDEEASARAKLRATLAELPRILPQPAERYVTIEADKIAWNADAGVWIDVEAFEAAAGDRTRLDEAIALYRGDLLPEIYDEWIEPIRDRLRAIYLRCLSERSSQARAEANFPLAIATARELLARDPFREDIVRRIMAMRYESGDRAGALSEYAAFKNRLRVELGATPMPETVAVAERIVRGEAPDDEQPEAFPGLAAEPGTLPFVGRHDEMEQLLESWSRAARGRGTCVFIGGESGIGKSRLVAELAHAVEERGGRVLAGATGSPEAVPYESVVDALRSALPLVASLRPSVALASVAALLPELHARAALPVPPPLDAESERIRLFESLFRCIAELAGQRPTLLLLEDFHRAQATSMDQLEFLLRRISGVPVMAAVTYRDDEENAQLHRLQRVRRQARGAGGSSISLGGLSAADVDDLRAAVPEIRERSPDALMAASHGNPLFITQVVADARDGVPAAAPASLQEAVALRVERLSPDARTIAEIAACIGDRFSRDAVRVVSAWDEPALSVALDELLDRRIVREAGGRGVLEYAFAHNLIYDAITRTIPANDAAIRRRRVARVLETLYPERFSELSSALAAHYEAGGDAANAGRCYLEAVRRSIAIGALEEGRALSARALALELPPRTEFDLYFNLVVIEARRGDKTARGAALAKLEEADRRLDDADAHRAALLQRVDFAAATEDVAAQERAIAALRAAVEPRDEKWSAAIALAEAKLAFTNGGLDRARERGDAALASSRAAGDAAGAVQALCLLARVEGYRGRLSEAAELFDEAAQLAASADDPVLELLALGSESVVAYQNRDLTRCRELAELCLELAVRLGDRPAEAQSLSRLGVALLGSDEHVAEARCLFAAAAKTYEESGEKIGAAAQLQNQAVLETRLGFFDRGTAFTEHAVTLFTEAGDERGRIGALTNLVYLKACVGDVEAARDIAAKALEDTRRDGFGLMESSLLENLAAAEGARGNYARAIELAEASFEARSRSESQVWSAKTLADVAIWRANCGALDAALDAVTQLLADEEGIARGADWPSYCYWAAAQVLRAAGEADESQRALKKAEQLMCTSADALEPEDRTSFLALPFHQAIERAAMGVWPDHPT